VGVLKKAILTAELSNPDSYRELQRTQSQNIADLSNSYRNLRLTDFDFLNNPYYPKIDEVRQVFQLPPGHRTDLQFYGHNRHLCRSV
jgi:hypothetical protein